MRLNERRKAFCEEYVKTLNAAEAARKSGYSEKTARTIGQQLLTNIDVQNYIQECTAKARSNRVADAKEVLEYLSETMRDAEESRRERTKAAELLGKVNGLFKDQTEKLFDSTVTIKVNLADCGGKTNNGM